MNSDFLKNLDYFDNKIIFNSIVSNPPYQKDTGNGSVAVYHDMMTIAELLGQKISMIYPARWVSTGRGVGIQDFREKELHSTHYVKFYINPGSSSIFENVIIKGGINYFLWDKENVDGVEYFYKNKYDKRVNLINDKPIMILDPTLTHIIEKINTKNSMKAFSRNHYGMNLESDYKIEELHNNDDVNDVKIYYSGKGGGLRETTIPRESTKREIHDFKVLASRTADPDSTKERLFRLNRIFYVNPFEICGGSFIVVGKYNTEEEAKNCVYYMKTDFATFLLGVITNTSSTTMKNYSLIPNIDFSNGMIIDKPDCILDFNNVEELDQQLFNFYNIDESEQDLIKSLIKPWKNKYDLFADGIF